MSMHAVAQKNWAGELSRMGAAAKAATARLGAAPAQARTALLKAGAATLRAHKNDILAANARDVQHGQGTLSKAMLDRLTLDEKRLEAIARGLEDVAAQPDPVGRILETWQRPNGLIIQRVSVPLGVIGMIYESRPNVTAEAASIALRGGNAIILRCGSDCFESSAAIAGALRTTLHETGLPADALQLIPTTDRAAVGALLQLKDSIDVIVPRGGAELIRRVEEESRIPLLRQYEGINHVYIDGAADAAMAVKVMHNAKLRRTSICGAAECVLFDKKILHTIAPAVIKDLLDHGCEVRGDDAVLRLDERVKAAMPSDFGHEFLDNIIAAKIVDGVEDAITHINQHHSNHTDAIITQDQNAAEQFCAGVNSAITMVNASTQFADGGEFGFGGELGIATGRLHARGPIGAAQLTTFKYIVRGDGQVRA